MDEKIDLEKLEKDERSERFVEAIEGEGAVKSEGFAPHFPASGAKGWGSPS